MVNKFGQLTNIHPFIEISYPSDPKTFTNILSFGDVCLTPMNEPKNIVSMF